MRKLIIGIILALFVSQATGCLLPIYDGDPARRTQQLLNSSEGLRLMRDDWERIWHLDQPDHNSPWRTHGGML
ncbi:MAG: hypothetical protein Q4C96_09225 [Planctomycetia bacterium]|nr:hypothetical protein [Planctomycetia bacterium]